MSKPFVLVLKGSPRQKGNSTILADRLADGARASGARVESFTLQDMDIKPCDACGACHKTDDGECVISDDMQILYPKLRDADAIVVASPIYWFTVNAQTKLFIDRWYAFDTSQGNVLNGKTFAIILTYADADPVISGAINAIRMYQDMLCYLKAGIAGIVYGSASDEGEITKQPALMEQAYKLGQKIGSAS